MSQSPNELEDAWILWLDSHFDIDHSKRRPGRHHKYTANVQSELISTFGEVQILTFFRTTLYRPIKGSMGAMKVLPLQLCRKLIDRSAVAIIPKGLPKIKLEASKEIFLLNRSQEKHAQQEWRRARAAQRDRDAIRRRNGATG